MSITIKDSIPNITLISAFFDIGRSNWQGVVGGHPLPGYLQRSTDHYFECFERLMKLDNDIVVFTSPDLLYRFDAYKAKKPNLCVVTYDFKNAYPELKQEISRIQNDPKFFGPIKQPYNPEYWSPEYVLVNYLKSEFVNIAIGMDIVTTDLISWIDFAYCRDDNTILTKSWSYNFDPEKIHFFSVKKFVPQHMNLREVINTNDVFIQGCHIVASKENWQFLEDEMNEALDILLQQNWIDDDQTLMYLDYCRNPQRYEIHYIDETQGGWFQAMIRWNNSL